MVIEMKQVSVIRDSQYLLKEIDWSVAPGQHWAVLGLNGSGKTTLLHMVNGYLFPSKGEITVLNKTFGKYDLRELRKSIGWVSTALQEKLYTKESAKDIVLSGKYATIGLYDQPEKEDMDRSDYLLELFGCSHLAHRPYQTLSQGEKQRVLIGRALMASPRLLILDEPCTGLDIIAKEQLLSVIEKLSREKDGATLIYVTHRTDEILPAFTHTLLLRRGQVHTSGETASLLTADGLSDFFEVPVHLEHHQDRTWVRLDSR